MTDSLSATNVDRYGRLRNNSAPWPLMMFLGAFLLAALFPAGAGAFEYGGTTGAPLAGTLTVSVVDGLNGTPVSGAWVMVGDEAGTPFAGNYGQTGPGGQIVFTNGLLSGPQTVTAAKDGYRVITIVDVDAAQVTLPLELFTVYDAGDPPLDTGVMVQGTVTNMSDVTGNVDVGIVREPLGLDWVMDFDVNALFGPAVTEYLTPAGYEGNYDLPRNVYMPSQTVPGSPAGALHRTPYMLRLPEGSVQRLFCMKGSVSLLTLLDVLGSGSIGTLLGSMAYTQFGLEDPLTVSGPGPITWPVTLDYTSFTRNLFFNVSNLPSVPSYGWPSGSTKRPFLVPVADIDIQDGTGRIVPMNLKLKLSTWAGGNEAVTVPIKTSGPMLSSNYLALVMVSAFDASDNPISRTGLSGVFYRVPAATGSTIVFNDFYPFINVMGSQIQFPTDRILQLYWGWEVDQAGVDFVRCDLDVVAEVDCDPAVEECPVGRVREYRDTNWTVLLPGSRTGFNLPALPPGAPRALGLPVDEPGVAYTLDWKLSEYGLFHGGYVFDYDNFPFSDYREHVSQVTQRSSYITNLPNRAPDPPWNESPSAGETGVSRTPTLAGSVFNDQDADSTHAASQWQVSATPAVNGAYTSPVYDSGTDSVNLTSVPVPAGVLGVGRYYWHVRYRDNGGKWSAYSAETWFETAGCTGNGDCDDGNFCNGAETCVSNVCQPGTNPCASDGLFCNGTESCNETTDQCVTTGNPCPSDGLFCNGTESCNETTDQCVTTGNPCPSDGLFCNGTESCNETTDQCVTTGNPCPSDGLYCNGTESCNETTDQCTNTGNPCPNDGLYCNGTESCNETTDQCVTTGNPCPSDGLYCNGTESCNETTDQCVTTGDPCPNDGLYCNGTESCNETTDQCVHSGDPCGQDGQFCNGTESCSETTDQCVHSGDPCAQDGLFCNGTESCNEASDQCVHSGDPCGQDGLFCNGAESCNEAGDQCVSSGNPCPSDGLFCNGVESCNEAGDQCATTGNPCPNDGLFCNGVESCNEAGDQCATTGNPCPNDGLFCNGVESCNEAGDQCATTGDPCPNDGLFCNGVESCNEAGDQCATTGDPCPNDGLFCNGVESCDEAGDQCATTGDPCPSDGQFCNGTESCNEAGDQCDAQNVPDCDDLIPCTDDFCDEGNDRCDATDLCSAIEVNPGCPGNAMPGDALVVPVNISNAAGVDTLGFDLSYDGGVLQFTGSDTTGCLLEGWLDMICVEDSGVVSCDGSSGSPLPEPSSGCLVNLSFQVLTGSAGASAPVEITALRDDLILMSTTPCSTYIGECTGDGDCDDGSYCNGEETCSSGICQAGTPVSCGDGVGCTVDSCNEGTDSCDHVTNNALCDDGTYCNGAETCSAVSDCQAGTPIACGDGVGCTVDSCNEGTDSCDHVATNSLCDDGTYCNGAETCSAVSDCQSGTPVSCGDAVGCTVDSCNEGTDSCDHVPTDSLCDDGTYCNGAETCSAVSDCQAGTAVSCGDGVGCTVDSCNEGTDSCDHVPTDSLCDDGAYCNGGETCSAVSDCQAGTPVDCGDAVGCTVDSCNEGTDACDHVPNNALCDDGAYCNGAETCSAVSDCQSGTPVSCADVVGCTVDSCNEGTDSCDHVPNNGLCDDGAYCNGAETCSAVSDCQSGTPVSCADAVGCTVDSCNEATDSCDHVPNNGLCDDGAYCNGAETCSAVSDCQSGTPVVCNDEIPCTDDFCDEGNDRCDVADQCAAILVNPGCPGNAMPGDALTVPVNLTAAGGVDTLGFDLSFDAGALQYTGSDTAGCLLEDWLGVVCVEDSGTVSCDGSSGSSLPDPSSGCLVNLFFNVLPGTAGASTVVEITALRDDLALMSTAPCSTYIGECTGDGDCDDGQFCNGEETCDAGLCQAGTPIACGDGVGCTVDSCNEGTDSCDHVATNSLCDDGTYCNGAETCSAVSDCQAGTPIACGDGVGCTVDSCNEGTDSCDHVATNSLCDDGTYCNGAETCSAVSDCQAGTPIACGDGVGCTVDSCNEGTDSCDHVATNSLCDDGTYCNGAETCNAVSDCQAGTPIACGDGVGCTVDSCNEGTDSCDHVANNALCDDGTYCNGAETCNAVSDCQAGTPVSCGDGVGCTVDSCNEGTDSCDHVTNNALCDDGTYCNGAETCSAVSDCQAGTPIACGDGVGCTVDSCNEGTDSCDHVANNALCDDGTYCNGAETCNAVSDCQAGTPIACGDAVGCTVDSCNEGTDSCDHAPNNALCDDGAYCNGAETCSAVSDCQAGTPVSCGDGVGCTVDSCNEGTDSCDHVANNALCDDGAYCNGAEICSGTSDCQSGTPVVCNDEIPCTDDFCDEGNDRCEVTDLCPTIQVNPACPGNAMPGDALVVPVNLTDAGGVDTLGFDLSFEAGALQYTGFDATGCLLEDWAGLVCAEDAGVVSCDGSTGVALPDPSSGCLVKLLFNVLPGTSGTSTVLEITALRDDLALMSTSSCSTYIGECTGDGDCDDGQFCNGEETCDAGLCQAGTPVECGDGVGCTVDSCNEGTDSCDHAATNSLCDDGSYCNGAETCSAVSDCQAGTPIACGDGVGCTLDSCNEGTDSCDHVANNALCDDGTYCNGAETCNAVSDCQAGTPIACGDGVSCTVDSCNEGTDSCDHVATNSLCDDGAYCNGAETCSAVSDCQAGTPIACGDGVSCTVDSCNEGTDSCDHAATDSLCNDGAYCNGAETCSAVSGCQAGTPIACGDGVGCTVDSCNEGTDSCDHAATDSLCDDGTYCNGAETCSAVSDCQAGTPVSCGDGVGCTVDSCNEGTDSCDHVANNALCDDGTYCNGAETCNAVSDCQAGTPIDCGDGVGCTVDSCNEGTDSCDHVANNALCDDGTYCNGAETCSAVSDCQAGTPIDCGDGVGCTVDSCNEGTDSCDHVANNALCDDGTYCNGAETCNAVSDCQAGTPIACGDAVGCTVDSCNEATDSCDHVPNNGLCDDGAYCNGAETCGAMSDCQPGTPVSCADAVGCTVDSCNEGTDSCEHVATDSLCDDGAYCNGAETCSAASDCQDGTPVVCNDEIPCTDDFCDEGNDRCDVTDLCAAIQVNPSCPGNAMPGDALTVPVNITDAGGVDTLGFDLSFDAGVLQYAGFDATGCLLEEWLDVVCVEDSGIVSCDGSSGSSLPEPNSGCLVKLFFSVLPGTAGAATVVEITGLRDDLALMSTIPCSTYIGECTGDGDCNDGIYCNGTETCSSGTCHSGTAVECGDGVGCTVDSCNEGTDSCDHAATDSLCDDGTYCNGAETCSAVSDCQSGTPVECGDGVGCTVDSCNEGTDSCAHAATDSLCDDGAYCNGAETCSAVSDCQSGTPIECGDGVSCTVDSCNEGTDSCDHATTDSLCDDGTYCNGVETCSAASDCQAGTPVECGDGVGCTVDSCNEGTDSCDHVANNALCDDGTYCNGAETCNAVSDCQAGTPIACGDAVGCTVDSCNEATDSCDHVPNNGLCDDGAYCNGAETCSAMSDCQPGTPVSCADAVGCTVDSCNEGTDSCDHVATDSLCDDGAYCNGAETCSAASDCQAGTAVECGDGVGCTVDSCNEGTDSCDHVATDSLCDDGAYCNGVETCSAESDCQAGTPVVCNDEIPCTDDFCDEGNDQCAVTDLCAAIQVNPACPGNGMPGDALVVPVNLTDAGGVDTAGFDLSFDAGVLQYTGSDTAGCLLEDWLGVVCVEESGTVSCGGSSAAALPDPSSGCLVKLFFNVLPGAAGASTVLEITGLQDDLALMSTVACSTYIGECTGNGDCDDGQFCNGEEICDAGLCQAGTPVSCGDGVGCTVDSCNEGTDSCDHAATDSLCDDGAYCNGVETCSAVSDCQAGTPVECGDGVSCTVDSCNEGTDSCDHAATDSLCNDGQFCNGAETCSAASDCQAGTTVDCGDGVGCTVDSCNEGTDSCDHVATDSLCDDGQFCNGAETCSAASDCQAGTPVSCGDGVSCTVDSCNEGTDSCDHAATDSLCDDGAYCNGVETCSAASDCQAGTPVSCGDGVSCTVDSCNEGTDSCDHAATDSLCDDGAYCNGTETCSAMSDCQAGTPVECGDGVSCTVDSCNEGTDSCDHSATDSLCDDGAYCNGAETCSAVSDCQAGTPVVCDDDIPCTGDFCDEGNDRCDVTDLCPAVQVNADCPGNAMPGDAVTVPVNITDAGGVDTLGFDVSFDAGVLQYTGFDASGCLLQDWANLLCVGDSGTVSCDGSSGSFLPDPSSGCLVNLFFNVLPGTAGASTVLEITGLRADLSLMSTVSCSTYIGECTGDADCNDGIFCNGIETCSSGSCQAGVAVECGDGVGCTVDSCNEGTDSCDHAATDSLCDDGQYCNGAETCSAVSDCQAGAAPCADDGQFCNGTESCNEGSDQCVSSGSPCADDGQFCNGTESCNEGSDQCVSSGSPCADDGQFCNGTESCNEGSDQCVSSGSPCADDGQFCNGVESCNEGSDQCVSSGSPCADDGQFCNGVESCNEGSDQCVSSGSPCADDGQFCNGTESCNEGSDQCVSSGSPCADDGLYCNGAESCNESTGRCSTTGNPCLSDGLFCNGVESCNEATDQCVTSGNPCPDDGQFCNGVESCNETSDQCESSGSPCADDGQFCNGTESCNEGSDQCVHSGSPCDDQNGCTDDTCDEAGDSCGHVCSAGNWQDACCADAACLGEPVCEEPVGCNDQDGDGYGSPAHPDCTYPVLEDCADDPSADAPGCSTCTCDTDPACAGCARCIHPGAREFSGDAFDTNCNNNQDCFIATASFGTEMSGKIDLLRHFRDRVLLSGGTGTALVDAYYKISPPIADFIRERPLLRTGVRLLLLPVVGLLNLVL